MNQSSIFLQGRWVTVPASDGVIPGTSLKAEWLRDQVGAFKLTKLVLTNIGTAAVALGSCHLLECDDLPDFTAEDMVYLDSGGGWPSGCIPTTGSAKSPQYAWEYWLPVFQPEEERQWAANIMQRDDLAQGVPGANYSFGGVSAIQHQDYGMVYAFTAPMRRTNTSIYYLCDPASGKLRRLALSCHFAGYALQPGERIESEEMAIGRFDRAQRGLEAWAEMSQKRSNIQLRHTAPPVGWLSWYGYRLTISAEEINRVADFINRTYPGFGFQYMQIDLGYCEDNVPGRWRKPNDRFPEGLGKFADDMRRRGFVPGIWCSLFSVEKGTVAGGMMKEETPWFWEPHCPTTVLDPTHPDVADYVQKSVRYFKSLGIKYFKVDFLNRTGRVDNCYDSFDKGVVRGAQSYRKALKLITEEMESDDFLYACSDLTMHSIGLVSTTMSACDIGNTGIRQDPQKLEFFREQFTSTMSRYFVQNKLIMLTADSINIAPPADLEEARMRVLFVGLSGGQIFLGDKIQEASPEIQDLVRRVLPPWGKIAVPVNLFAGRTPEIFKVEMPERTVYAFFNFQEKRIMPLALPDEREYDVWDFFEQRYEGRVKGTFAPEIPYAAARAFTLTPASDAPHVIGTTFHVTSGGVELSEIQCENGVLHGKLTRPAGDKGKIIIWKANAVHELELTGTGSALDWSF